MSFLIRSFLQTELHLSSSRPTWYGSEPEPKPSVTAPDLSKVTEAR